MPRTTAHKSRLAVSAIFGGFAVLSFAGGIASNIVANYVSPWFDHHKWVIWLACSVAVVVAIIAAVWDRSNSADFEADGDVVARDKVTVIHHHHDSSSARSDAAHQLPTPKPDFTGRRAELEELKEHLRRDGQRGVAIAGAQGMGGVGKTELAVKLAAELKDEYPDAQIFFDLRGVSANPVTPEQALEYAIRALEPQLIGQLPEALGELQGLYRSLLYGKRALIVWDNARDAAQVEPLVPPDGCALIVTSRLHFTLPGLHACNLAALPPADARQLLQRIAARLSDEEADTLASLCGRLPLALRVTGSALAERPNIKPEKYAGQLAEAGKRLALIEAALDQSYALLGSAQQRLWRQLAVFPATFDERAAAVVWQMPADEAEAAAANALAELLRYSLVDYAAANERYELHDLARVFAAARLDEKESAAAQLRHAQHFRAVLAEADDLYLAGGGQIKTGLALYDRERANIAAGMAWAASQLEANQQAAELCVEYPDAGAYVLNLRLHSRERIRWLEKQLAAARRLQRRKAEGMALGNLGIAYAELGEVRRAIEFYEQYLAIAREIGDRRGEGNALGSLGNAYLGLGEMRRAIEFYEQSLPILREIGDRRGEGAALGNLGIAYRNLGEVQRAIEFYEQQLLITCEIGDRRGEGNALGNLGVAYKNLGEVRRAIKFYEQALLIDREISDRRGEGTDLWNMALALDELGDRAQAIVCAEAALKICEEIEDPNAAKVRAQLAEWRK